MSHGKSQGEGTNLVNHDKSQDGVADKYLVSKSKRQGKPCEPRARSKASLSKSQDGHIQVL